MSRRDFNKAKQYTKTEVDALKNNLNIFLYDYCNNDGVTTNDAALASLVSALGSSHATIIINRGNYAIANNFSFPVNVVLKFERGGMISVANTKVLTILGDIIAGNYQIFAGVGTVNKTLSPTPYNICWYEGDSLNKKWNKMSVNFTDKIRRTINIPKPAKDQIGAIKNTSAVQERWSWKIDAPWIIDDTTSNILVNNEGEFFVPTNIGTGMIISTSSAKIENIVFNHPLFFYADATNRLDKAIEIRGCARLEFLAEVDIGHADLAMLIGGSNQTAPVGQVFIPKFHCGYPKNSIMMYGKNDSLDNVHIGHVYIDGSYDDGASDCIIAKGLIRSSSIGNVYYNKIDTRLPRDMVVIQSTVEGSPRGLTIGRLEGEITGIGLRTADESGATVPKIQFLRSKDINTSGSTTGFKLGYTREAFIDHFSGGVNGVIDSDNQYTDIKGTNRNWDILDNSSNAVINGMGKKYYSQNAYPTTGEWGIGNIIVNKTDLKVFLKWQHANNSQLDFIPLNSGKRAAKVAIAITGTNIISWINPEAAQIVVERVTLYISTKSTVASTVDIGTTTVSGTTSSDNLIDGVSGFTAGLYNNVDEKGTNGKTKQILPVGGWITGSQASGDVAGIVGYLYIEYFIL